MELDDFLTDAEIRHYNRFLAPGQILIHPREESDQSWRWTATFVRDDAPQQERTRLAYELAGRKAIGEPDLIIEGAGPPECSSSQVLAMSPEVCWDVCGYYRRLGVHWRATRRQIMEAYHRLGESRADLAYAVSQLFDAPTRREYDRMPLGGVFYKDKDVAERMKRMAHMVSAQRNAQGTPVTTEDILEEWGYRNVPSPGSAAGERPSAQAALPRARTWLGSWGWWRLAGDKDTSWRAYTLEDWQLMLVREFGRRGMACTFAVGLFSGDGFYVRTTSYSGSLIVFLGKDEPTPQLAQEAVDRVRLVLQHLEP